MQQNFQNHTTKSLSKLCKGLQTVVQLQQKSNNCNHLIVILINKSLFSTKKSLKVVNFLLIEDKQE